MSSRQLHSHRESDGLSLPERTRKSKKSSDQPDMDQQTTPQPRRPGSVHYPQEIQLPLQPARLPELSPPHHQPLDLHKHQLPMQTCCLGWAHHKYHHKICNLQLPTFLKFLVLCLWKTGSALAVNRRYVIRKLRPSSVKTCQQDHKHILYHQGLDPLQQWTIPLKEIQTNLDTHLLWD